jgi:hypothetical protein
MATTKIVDLINRCEIISQDKTSVRWPKQEWLNGYNDAILFVVNRRPDKAVKNVDFVVDVTNTKQTLPADALSLFTITRNVGSGRPIRKLSRNQLDDQYENWHQETAVNIDHFMYDERDPKIFYIYPRPVSGPHTIEIIYPFAPEAVQISDFTNNDETISVDDSFLNPILDFMLYRAYSKDADYAANGQRANDHLMAAENALGSKTQADAATIRKESRNG